MYFTESPLLTCSHSPYADLTYPSIPVYIRWPFYPQGFSLFPPSHKCRRHFNPPELRYPSIVSYGIITPSHLPIGNVGRLRELSWVIIPKLQIPNYLHSTHILTQISQNRVGERESESERVELSWYRSLGLQRHASVIAGPALKLANTIRTLAHPHRWLPHSREDAHHQPPATSGIDSQRLLEAWLS
jgi:hypothetical protein